MSISFAEIAWEQYQEWVETEPQIKERINELIKQTSRDPSRALGNQNH